MTDIHDKEKWGAKQWIGWLGGFLDVTSSRGSDDVKGMLLRLSKLAVIPGLEHGTEHEQKDRELARAIIEEYGA